MARKIFVSYKYSDSNVAPLLLALRQYEVTQCRHYVTTLEMLLESKDYIYKGEKDGETLANFKESTIESKLRAKIFDSTITIVFVSKGMKDPFLSENEQWIPWEISYSLKEMTKGDRTSKTNAMLIVAIPDETNSYSYIVNNYTCVTSWKTDFLFRIIRENMFNRNQKRLNKCATCGGYHHTGDDHSYIYPVKWKNFISNIDGYINQAINVNNYINDYDIKKNV